MGDVNEVDGAGTLAASAATYEQPSPALAISEIQVDKIRPEEGLGRKRDRNGHDELRSSIAEFGVLTPITVRPANDGTDDYLLIKGQGRTLACRMLGVQTIPAIIVDVAEDVKVQQFLVENVARLKMRSIDRALLISRARAAGEETSDVARRFGVSPTTVRRLELQLTGVNNREIGALRKGRINLSTHAVIARYVPINERADAIEGLANLPLKAKEVGKLLEALAWNKIAAMGEQHKQARLRLLIWACSTLAAAPPGLSEQRVAYVARALPHSLEPTKVPNAKAAER